MGRGEGLMSYPNQAELLCRFDYDTEAGRLIRKTGRFSGQLAGSLNSRRRRIASIGDKSFSHYKLVWIWHHGAVPEGLTIDHIDRDPANDRIENLRLATPSQQQLNRAGASRQGLPKGVTVLNGRFKAAIGTGGSGNNKHLGLFDTPEEAHAAYCRAAKELHDPRFWKPA